MKRILFVLALASACSVGNEAKPPTEISAESVPFRNARSVDGMLVGGQPTRAELERGAKAGIKTVINLRTASEGDLGASLASELGLAHVSIPVAGSRGLTIDTARRLDEALATAAKPVLIHCASGNRVGALLAIRAHAIENKSPEQALAIGKASGLTRLEPVVREKLGLRR